MAKKVKIHCPVEGCKKQFRLASFMITHMKKKHKGVPINEDEIRFMFGNGNGAKTTTHSVGVPDSDRAVPELITVGVDVLQDLVRLGDVIELRGMTATQMLELVSRLKH